MANPIRLLSMQAGKAQDMTRVGHSTAAPELTEMLAAAFAAGMPEEQWIACRWAWMQDYTAVNRLRCLMASKAVKISKREKWRDPEHVILEDLVDLALHEIAGITRTKSKQVDQSETTVLNGNCSEHGDYEVTAIRSSSAWSWPKPVCPECKDMKQGAIDLPVIIENKGAIKTRADRYNHLGWHHEKWNRWKDQYESIYSIARDWETAGRGFLRRAQGDE